MTKTKNEAFEAITKAYNGCSIFELENGTYKLSQIPKEEDKSDSYIIIERE